MFKKIEKKDGYYWIATSNTSKVGYPSLFRLLMEESPIFWLTVCYIAPVIVTTTVIISLSN